MALDNKNPSSTALEDKKAEFGQGSEDNKESGLESKLDGKSILEEKLSQLERRFAELENKYATSQERMNAETMKPKDSLEQDNDKIISDRAHPDSESLSATVGRIKVVTSKIEDGERKDFLNNQPLPEPKSNETKHAALLRKTILDLDESIGEIEIYNSDLRERLRTLLQHHPAHSGFYNTSRLPSPYEPLILNWDVLWAESEQIDTDERDAQTRSDLRALLETISAGSGDRKLDNFMQTRITHKKQKSIMFDNLWTIFPPGAIVCGKLFLKQDQLLIVEDNFRPWTQERSRRSGGPSNDWRLDCMTYDFTGSVFQRKAVTLYFSEFTDAKPITSLPFYPLDALEPEDLVKARTKLLERGRRFRQFCTARERQLYTYSGTAILGKQGFRAVESDDDSDSDSDIVPRRRRRRRQIAVGNSRLNLPLKDSSVMIDFESYCRYDVSRIGDTMAYQDTNECICSDCKNNDALRKLFKWDYDGQSGKEEWEDLQLMLCPPRVLGYVLKDKQWAQLAVDSLDELPTDGRMAALDNIYLSGDDHGKETKELLFGLVKNHGLGEAQSKNSSYELQDFVADKGKGLVILLYGAPGVGKTSTAQMIAEAAGKPLMSIGVADVGTKAREVEARLETIFDLATAWKAILLIDEADVFLQDRSRGGAGPSAEGSGLVSVFLRVLEYYRGILLLTTNQIAQFDVAVQSRVHIALKYDRLDRRQTTSIFMRFIDQFERKGLVDKNDYEEMKQYSDTELFKKHFDGRQIRNIVSSAMGYARGGKSERMNIKHIKHVVGYVEDFQKDLAGSMREWQKQQKSASLN